MVWFHWKLLGKGSAGFHKGLVHMKQLWRLQSQCRRPQEHASGGMSVTGRHCSTWSLEGGNGEAKPLPAHTVTGAKKYLKKQNKKRTTNQWLISQNDSLATHRCPQQSDNNSTLSNRYREQTKTQGHPRHLWAVYAVEIHRDVPASKTQKLSLSPPSPQHPNALTSRPSQLSYMLATKHSGTERTRHQSKLRIALGLWLCTWKYKILKQDSWLKNITNLLPTLKDKAGEGGSQ